MNERERFNFAELKEAIFEMYNYKCPECGRPVIQLAHRIPQRKHFLIKDA